MAGPRAPLPAGRARAPVRLRWRPCGAVAGTAPVGGAGPDRDPQPAARRRRGRAARPLRRAGPRGPGAALVQARRRRLGGRSTARARNRPRWSSWCSPRARRGAARRCDLEENGFHRLQAGRAIVVCDAGAPPPGRPGDPATGLPRGADRFAHAGTLSFEMSVGRERLIVNCGAAPAAEVGLARRAARHRRALHPGGGRDQQRGAARRGPRPPPRAGDRRAARGRGRAVAGGLARRLARATSAPCIAAASTSRRAARICAARTSWRWRSPARRAPPSWCASTCTPR